jgi:murein DD-endopeptidase MepM/ murein hydrolase activator NlpD
MVKRRVVIRFSAFLLLLLMGAQLLHAAPPAKVQSWTVRVQPIRLVNGAPVFFRVKPPSRLTSLRGHWMGHEIPFSFDSATQSWFALAGVSLETLPGEYPLELTGETAQENGTKEVSYTYKQVVDRARYPQTRVGLGVNRKFTEPSAEQKKQIEEGQQVKEEYFSRVTPDREWSGGFIAPVRAEISDVYGSQRIFNGKASRSHLGLDFRVPTGTVVSAMNDGTVLLARPLYFEGNLVVIDHGQGLLTLYLHLSKLAVKEGDRVKRGEEVGLSGGTGRATGPHLHLAVRWQDIYINPAVLLKLRLPRSDQKANDEGR